MMMIIVCVRVVVCVCYRSCVVDLYCVSSTGLHVWCCRLTILHWVYVLSSRYGGRRPYRPFEHNGSAVVLVVRKGEASWWQGGGEVR